ncbi:MAG: hypothetical protein K0R54_4969 [Clostridiaceae bacterium]|jgi:hypothetical protein|nr:hypothetical protein [Clostridiaceae bacterium]
MTKIYNIQKLREFNFAPADVYFVEKLMDSK